MSSLLRRIQRAQLRAVRHKGRDRFGMFRGTKLGVTNPRAPKPLSGSGYGSRRGTTKRPFHGEHHAPTIIKFAPFPPAATRVSRKLAHQYKMASKGYRARPA